MSMTIPVQLATLLSMIAMGSVFGILLDTYQRFIQRSRRARWIVFLHDILFWLLQALLIFYVLFVVNYGEIRVYLFLALLCGFAAYQALIKSWYVKLLERIIVAVISLAKWIKTMILRIIVAPIKWILLTALQVLIFFGKVIWKMVYALLHVVKWILFVFLLPVKWFFRFLWLLLPKSLKKFVGNYYTKSAGLWHKYRQLVYKSYSRIKNRWKK